MRDGDTPVIYLEHRWLHGVFGLVPEEMYRVPIGKARTACEGKGVTIVSTSYMTLEAIREAEILVKQGVDSEVVDVSSIRPLDSTHILESIRKTDRVVVVDADWGMFGFGSEILALAAEELLSDMNNPAARPRGFTGGDRRA